MDILESLFGYEQDNTSTNNKKTSRPDKKTKIKRKKRNETDIYNSNNKSRVKSMTDKLASDRFARSDDRNIIHNNENFSDSEYSDSEYSGGKSYHTVNSVPKNEAINFSDPSFFINTQENFIDNRKHERRIVKKNGDNNNFKSQFDPLQFDNPTDPSSYNAVNNTNGSNATAKRAETERRLALDGGYSNFGEQSDNTYGIFPADRLTHNNMVPYFRSSSYGNNNEFNLKRNAINQRKMEEFTGSTDNVAFRHKREQKPLFSPLVGMTNIHGNQVNTEEFSGRYIPSKERRGELPFQQIRVTPGLNLGANQEATSGFHDMHRVYPKTTDELRLANNPKISYKGVIIPGMKGEKGPVVAQPVQRKANTFRELTPDDYAGGLSYIRAPKLEGEINKNNIATVNRGVSDQQWYGGAENRTQSTPDTFRGNYKQSSRQNFKHAGPGPVTMVDSLQARPDSNSYIPDPTQRSQSNTYIGPAGTSRTEGGHAFNVVNGMPEPTKRDLYGRSDRAGATVTGSHKGYHVYDLNDVPDINMRNIHSSTDRAGKGVNVTSQGHHTFDPNDVPNINMRNIHGSTDRAGKGVNVTSQGHHTFDPNDVPNINMRNIHSSTDRAGKGVNVTSQGHHTFDPNDVPDINMRNIHSSTDRAGKGVNVTSQGHHTFDPNDVPNINMRNIHGSTDRAGKGVNVTSQGHHTFDPNDVPDINMRNIHGSTDRAGTNINGAYKGHNTFDPNDVPDMNMRNIHNKTDRAGAGVNGAHKGNHAFDPNDVPDNNMRNIHNKIDRAGAGVNGAHKGIHAFDPNDVPDVTMRTIHGRTDRAGAGVNGTHKSHHVYDPSDVPDPTKRDMYKSKRSGGGAQSANEKPYTFEYINNIPDSTGRDMYKSKRSAGGAQSVNEKPYTFDYINNIPDPTGRDMYKSKRSAGGAQSVNEKPYTFDYINNIPDPTERDMHKSGRAAGGAYASSQEAQRSRRDANNMLVNITKEQISKGRSPTTSNYNRGPTVEFTQFELKNPIMINRSLIPELIPNTNRAVPNLQPDRHSKYYVNNRVMSPQSSLEGNPFINNMVHRAVDNR